MSRKIMFFDQQSSISKGLIFDMNINKVSLLPDFTFCNDIAPNTGYLSSVMRRLKNSGRKEPAARQA